MNNKHIVLIERNSDNDSPVIAAIATGPGQTERITTALSEHFDCEVTKLKVKIDKSSQMGSGSFEMKDDDNYPPIEFDIYPIWIY